MKTRGVSGCGMSGEWKPVGLALSAWRGRWAGGRAGRRSASGAPGRASDFTQSMARRHRKISCREVTWLDEYFANIISSAI